MNQERNELQEPTSRQRDLGFSKQDVDTTLRVLDGLLKLPTIPDYVVADAIHELRENQASWAKKLIVLLYPNVKKFTMESGMMRILIVIM